MNELTLIPSPAIVPQTAAHPAFRGRHPAALTFGTSGLRGLVTDITDLETCINTRGFLDYLRRSGLPPSQPVCIAGDLRPSSDSPERSILRAVAAAISESGFQVAHLGRIPTPALASFALQRRWAGIMVTGSHIPFDRNGIKFYKPDGEVLKGDEPGILEAVEAVRLGEYLRPAAESSFGDDGMFKKGCIPVLPAAHPQAPREYIQRYLEFFPAAALKGARLVFYQHSAVGRDLLPELLAALGADVIAAGRSNDFVPIDTEALPAEKLARLQELADQARGAHGPVDAVVSTDGDSDRPLVAGVASDGRVEFLPGDLLGILAADYLSADAVVVPVSANDAVDRWAASRAVPVFKTRIGSPYVIESMQQAREGGASRVVGWEANGGFLTGSDITHEGRTLAALPTRDAALPLIAAIRNALEQGVSLVDRMAALPRRFSKAGLIDNFPLDTSRALLQRWATGNPRLQQVEFGSAGVRVTEAGGHPIPADAACAGQCESIRRDLEHFFTPRTGFGRVTRINWQDGCRVFFDNGDIAHVRPSGNAPQLRIYAVADTRERADAIVAAAISGPEPILRRLETELSRRPLSPPSSH